MDLKICRICLNNSATISIFDQVDEIQYCTKIMRCTNIVITENDGLPSYICSSCVNELIISYNFVQKCETSDNALRCLDISENFYADDDKAEISIKIEDIKNEQVTFNDFFTDDNTKDGQAHEVSEQRKPKFKVKRKAKFSKKKIKRDKLGPVQCALCGLMANSPSAMSIHMRTHTGERPFICSECDARYPTKGSLKRHTETRHMKRERKFTCETCGNSFFRKNDIITHMRVHTDERPYVCPFCSQRFRQVASLIRHKRVHTKEKPYSCPICGKKFADKTLVNKHLTVHSDEKNFTCHLCSKSVKTKTALTTHLSLHTNEKQNICSFCGMAFAMKGNLQTHIRRVHSEKSGQCAVCSKAFSDLEAHMRKHTGEKPFACAICNQAFASKRSLGHHILFKHENADKFKCSIGECIKTFPTAMMLEFHLLKQHTNHTPYICQHCSRGFFRTSDLSRHLRVSHMDMPFKLPMKALVT